MTGINVYVYGFIPLFISEFKQNQFAMVGMEVLKTMIRG